MNTPSKQYAVGYGRPPEHSKWKKGQCGNPKRIRKRSIKPVATIVDEFFASEINVIENGISRRRSAFGIIFLQLWNKAMAGNTRALRLVKKYMDFAASRDSSDGMRVEIVDEEPRPKKQGGENG
jgi:hypothetical protein